MIVLVEGIDKAGKSTIVTDLKKHFPSAYFCKNTFKPGGADPYDIGQMTGIYQGIYQLAKACKDRLVILDRGHITELVYGKVKRGYDALEYFNWEHYEKELKKYMKVIYVQTPVNVLELRFKKLKETYIEAHEINKILVEYGLYLHSSCLSQLHVSGVEPKEENLIKIIKFIGDGYQRD